MTIVHVRVLDQRDVQLTDRIRQDEWNLPHPSVVVDVDSREGLDEHDIETAS